MKELVGLSVLALLVGCTPTEKEAPMLPSLAYSEWAKANAEVGQKQRNIALREKALHDASLGSAARAHIQLVSDSLDRDAYLAGDRSDYLSNLEGDTEIRPSIPNRPYNGPLTFGETSVSPSLWESSNQAADLMRDDRAWQPMDLVTILVTESSTGSKEGDTEIKGKSSITATIGQWLGLMNSATKRNSGLADENGNLINATTQNNYKGEGETTRKDTLTATISAMVVEVLPGNILRIEGEKIISLNQEEQTIAISGLVRPRDINSNNEVLSSKIANLRIDYYGRGTVSEAQYGGWFTRMMRILWPF